ncbi:hypothetical protein I4F81_002725 [Pyropia yezoensis]|uniref:Uncharacterized protein n=1 Tax=Pyropia yezoensis TaxID=2788 RepID=A0ACC3BRT3_PYRYE|nr:hypothetical protein I4F81_002725 [Neopyropia yezoensis]
MWSGPWILGAGLSDFLWTGGSTGAPRDPVWEYVEPAEKHKHYRCKFCRQQMYGNPTLIKTHIVSAVCKPPADVNTIILNRLKGSSRAQGDSHLPDELASLKSGDALAAKKPCVSPGTLLTNELNLLSQDMDAFVSRSVQDGDLVVCEGGWSDRLRNTIYHVVLYTPEPMYMETKVWGESQRSADNTASFLAHRIEALGAPNVVVYVSDTGNKMKTV